ncbi:hypothetical protein BP6252_07153 [Coleophoma cylindrospora]|uniref:Transcription factor domain-containing protein n=1 Tax=Coleophoma cylindrospora TaxID=1849047 RepID=A0A3D8RH13_9HELO|nr:hypothetical protein BP6252_07153 [Coleophoma cylindrospora]
MPPNGEMLLSSSDMAMDSVLRWPIYGRSVPHLRRMLETPTVERIGEHNQMRSDNRERISRIGTTLLNLDSQVINSLVENFLAHNHIKNPILDVVSLQADVRGFAETGPQWDSKSCLILLVCAVSSLSAPLGNELRPGPSKNADQLAVAEAYFQASQRRIGMLYHENTIVAAQCSFLTAVYLMSKLEILAAWKSFVQASSQCLGWMKSQGWQRDTNILRDDDTEMDVAPGLARDRKRLHDRHVEESLYWSCLKSELEVRFELSLPGSGLCEMDYPHLFPDPPSAVPEQDGTSPEDSEASWSSPRTLNQNTDRQNLERAWYFYLAEIALKRMINNVLIRHHYQRQRNTHRTSAENDLEQNVLEFDMQVQKWYETLPSSMSFTQEAGAHTTDILRLILRSHLIDIRLSVRFPAIQKILSTEAPVSIDSLSATHLRLAREALESAAACIESNRPSFYHRHQGTWLMLRSVTRCSFHILGVALNCNAVAESREHQQSLEDRILPQKWKSFLAEVRMMLEYWSDENNDVKALDRIFKELLSSYEKLSGIH